MATIARYLSRGLLALQLTLPALAQTSATSIFSVTATSAGVAESGVEIKINILRWSSDEQRTQLFAALNSPPVPAVPPAGDGGGAERGGRGAAGRGGRGGRGDAPGATGPFVALAAAIGKAPTIGYLWTNEPIGYAVKYAYRLSTTGGGERIVLAVDRRLGGQSPAWTLPAPATDYQFTLIELRLDPSGAGEGKTSLTTKVIDDEQARTIALENYDAAPAILSKVRR
jgi:hypothetical protein